MRSWSAVISIGLVLGGVGLWSPAAMGKCGSVEPWIAGQEGDRLPPDPELYIFRAQPSDLEQLEIRCEDDGRRLGFHPTAMLAADDAGWSLTRVALRSGDCRALLVHFNRTRRVQKRFTIDPDWRPPDSARRGACIGQADREVAEFACGDHDVLRLRFHQSAPIYRLEFVADVLGRKHEFEQWAPTEVGQRCGRSADPQTTCLRLGEYMCWPDNYPTSLLSSPVRVRATAVYPDGSRVRGSWQWVSPGRGGLQQRDDAGYSIGDYTVERSACRPQPARPRSPAGEPVNQGQSTAQPPESGARPLLWSILGLLSLLTVMAAASWHRAQRWRTLGLEQIDAD